MDSKTISFLELVYNSNQNIITPFLNDDYLNFINKTKSFKHFDYCPNYSICFSTNDRINKSLNSPAIFTINDQKIEYGSFGLSDRNSLIVSIKCEYLNRNSTLSSYTFNVKLEYFKNQPQYVNNISVNLNGTVLLLSSDISCFVVNTPYELSKYDESHCDASNSSISESIKGNLLIKYIHLNDNIHVVKASWNTVFSNTFLVVTNEYVVPSNVPSKSQVGIDFTTYDYVSFIRIYNLDKGIEDPLYEIRLSERLCRLGQFSSSHMNYKFQKTRGRVVDIFMNSNDKSSLGSFTLFALSNYGYIFCYCPIIINSIYDFNMNTPLIKKFYQLSKTGFDTKFGKQILNNSSRSMNDVNNNADEIKNFIANVNKYIIGHSEFEFYPIVIRLMSDDFIPDCNLIYSYPVFESFIILSTDPLIIIVSQSDSKISVYRPKLELYPSTSLFYKQSLVNALHVCVHSQHIQFGFKDSFSFKRLSQYDFLYYSRNAVYHFNYNHSFTYEPLFNLKKSSECFYSDPIIIKTNIVGLTNMNINKDNLVQNDDIKSDIARLNNDSTIIITHEFKKSSSKNIEFVSSILMNKFDKSVSTDSSLKFSNSDSSSITITSFSTTPKEEPPIIKNNNELFSKINKSKTLVNGYKDIFKSLKLSNDNDNLNQKSVEMIKELSKLDSDVITNLESLPVYEKVVSEYVSISNEVSSVIDEFFNETIDHYHTIFNHVKARIDKIKERRKWMSARHSDIIKTLRLYNIVNNVDDSVDQVSNIISEFHLRYSNIILTKFDEHINNYTYSPPNVLNKQLEIDQWFYNTYKNNVDLMYKIHSRIKTIRTSMDTMV